MDPIIATSFFILALLALLSLSNFIISTASDRPVHMIRIATLFLKPNFFYGTVFIAIFAVFFLDSNIATPMILAFIFLASYRMWLDRESETPDLLARQ